MKEGKTCGVCTKCCTVANIPEVSSPRGELCSHCTNNECSIYHNKPDACTSFQCLWLQELGIPDHLRPDICHVMFEVPCGCNVIVGYVDSDFPNAHEELDLRILITRINEAGYSIVLVIGDKKLFSLTEGQTREEMHEQLNRAVRLNHANS